MTTNNWKLDDERPKLVDELDVDLSSNVNEVRLFVEHEPTETLVVDDTATTFTAGGSPETVEYEFADGDLNRAGPHRYEWVIERTAGDVESFPKDKSGYRLDVADQVNRSGPVSKASTGVAGPLDEILFNEQASTPQQPAADDWGLYFDTNGNLIKVDENGNTTQVGGGGAGSATEAQEDGVQLTTDTALLNWQSGLTATNPVGDDINLNVDESEVDHDSLSNFVSNEHIDHSSVSISSGTALTGGGDITASRTLNVDETAIDHDNLLNYAANEHFTEGSISHDTIDQTTVDAGDHHTKTTQAIAGTALSKAGDTLNVDETAIDHDNLLNYAANEHFVEGSISHDAIDQTTVDAGDHHTKTTSASGLTDVSADSVSGAHHTKTTQAQAGTSLSKAGDTLNVSGVSGTEINLSDIAGNNLTVDAVNDELDASATGGSAVEAQEDGVQLSTDTTLIDWQSGLTATNPSGDDININVDESEIDHDSLLNFVSNEHIDHSSVSISAGTALTGGGDITASRTLNVDETVIDHDNLTNFVANEHVDHSSVSISGGTGLSGGGDLTSSRTLNVNLTDVQWPDTVNTVAAGASPYTISPGELVFTDAAAGQVEIDLPNSGSVNATDKFGIIVNDASNNTIIDPQTEDLNGLNSTVVLGDPGAARIIYWDGSEYFFDRVDNGELINNTIGITAGDGLKNGGTPALGGSVTLNIEPADFAGAGLKDDGSDNLETQDVRVVSSSLNAQDIDTILMDASGGARSVQLPTPSSDINVTVKKTDSSGNAVDITTPGAETIDGQTSLSITSQYTSRTIVSDGSNYFIV